MANNLSYLQTFLSGGSSNTSAAKSLGGPISTTRVLSQTATAPTTITGVTIDDAAQNGIGDGILSYFSSSQTLTWQPPNGSTGTAVAVGTSGQYAIQGGSNGGILFITVVAGSLPGANQSNTITIANQVNKVWDDISKAESLAGDTEYRCLYLKNTHSTDTMIDVRIWRGADASGQDVISVELDPAGIGDGSATGVADGALEATKVVSGYTYGTGKTTYTVTAHGYSNGDLVKVAGVTPSGANTTATISGVATNTFDITMADPGAFSSAGTVARYSESSAPATVTWTNSAINETSSLVVGDLAAGEAIAFWQKRIVPANTTTSTTADTSRIAYRAYI